MRPYAPGAPNRVQATVLYSIFMGSITDLFIDVKGKRLRAQTDNTTKFNGRRLHRAQRRRGGHPHPGAGTVKRDGTSRLHYLMLVPGVGVILFFIATSVLMTVAQSFGLFSVTGNSAFTLKNWAIVATKEVRDSLLFSLKMGVLSSIGTLLVAFPGGALLPQGRLGEAHARVPHQDPPLHPGPGGRVPDREPDLLPRRS